MLQTDMKDIDYILVLLYGMTDLFVFLGCFALGMICIALVSKVLLGKNSSMKHALCAALGLIVFYALNVLIRSLDISELKGYMRPLPFIFFVENELTFFDFATADLHALCDQLLNMIALCFLVNWLHSFTPANLKPLGWLVWRLIVTFVAFFGYYMLCKVVGKLYAHVPHLVEQEVSIISMSILAFMFFVACSKYIVSHLVTVANPIFIGIFTLLFINKVGKNVSRAIFTTAIAAGFILLLEKYGYQSFPIGPESLVQYSVFMIFTVLLWWIIGVKF